MFFILTVGQKKISLKVKLYIQTIFSFQLTKHGGLNSWLTEVMFQLKPAGLNDLQIAFVSVKPIEKEAALLVLVGNIVGVPKANPTEQANQDDGFQPKSSQGSGSNLSKFGASPLRSSHLIKPLPSPPPKIM